MHYTRYIKKTFIATTLFLSLSVSGLSAQVLYESPLVTNQAYSCIDIPKSVSFCGEKIDLTRFDRRERIDRELLAFTYMHSSSIQMIKRANRYFPMIESILRENKVPDDFKYLMIIESNANPLARSGAGAAGLWQFMPATAREFGLEVGNTVDERYHVEKSTRAACRLLKQAYSRFGSWVNVAASYNAGQGRISNALEDQYEDDALDLQLVEETTRYVYRIIAAKIMFSNPQQFGFRLRSSDLYPPIPYREVKVEATIDDLPRFAKSQGTTYALLRNLNPWLRSSSLHVHGGKIYYLQIPDKTEMHYNPRVIIPHDRRWVVD
ncbi:lytic transglycosylase domain-containing protein [uncultured Bacteroides sp.]|uniref:lytic transglycosylase domain-containing protein n=1 Tax=uncultured Bacteroides sp. TaxID=162156 RepID=UPI002607715B|nr:lytic transglycosylase domain-containing protein [uncultured Bacteroides sp.]